MTVSAIGVFALILGFYGLTKGQAVALTAFAASLLFGVGVNSDAGLTGSVVVNERNFDICNPPTSWEDIWEGRAWRGAGQGFDFQRHQPLSRETDHLAQNSLSVVFSRRAWRSMVTSVIVGSSVWVQLW